MALVIGDSTGHLGQWGPLDEVFDREEENAPPVDLEAERRHGAFILENRDYIRARTDLSDGGLAMAAFELAEAVEWLMSQAAQASVPPCTPSQCTPVYPSSASGSLPKTPSVSAHLRRLWPSSRPFTDPLLK